MFDVMFILKSVTFQVGSVWLLSVAAYKGLV